MSEPSEAVALTPSETAVSSGATPWDSSEIPSSEPIKDETSAAKPRHKHYQRPEKRILAAQTLRAPPRAGEHRTAPALKRVKQPNPYAACPFTEPCFVGFGFGHNGIPWHGDDMPKGPPQARYLDYSDHSSPRRAAPRMPAPGGGVNARPVWRPPSATPVRPETPVSVSRVSRARSREDVLREATTPPAPPPGGSLAGSTAPPGDSPRKPPRMPTARRTPPSLLVDTYDSRYLPPPPPPPPKPFSPYARRLAPPSPRAAAPFSPRIATPLSPRVLRLPDAPVLPSSIEEGAPTEVPYEVPPAPPASAAPQAHSDDSARAHATKGRGAHFADGRRRWRA